MNLKKHIAFAWFLSLCAFFQIQSQKPINTSYFDRSGKLSSVEEAFYFRETTDTIDFYRSFYAKDTSLYFQGKIISAKDSSDQKNIYSGLCIWYYPNGNKKKEYTYNHIGTLNGPCTDFYEDGKPKKMVDYLNGKSKDQYYNEFGTNGAHASVFEEEFIDNRGNWKLSANDTGSVKIKIGGLEFTSKKNVGIVRPFPHKIRSKCFSVESIVNSNYLSDTTRAGLIFGFENAENYNYFLVSKHKCYLGKVRSGKEIKKINGFVAYSLKGNGINKIKIIYIKNNLFYSINDEILFSEENVDIISTNVGLGIKSIGVALFDKLTIREYENELTIEPIDPKIKNDNNFIISNKDYGIQSATMGLILNKQGLILSSAVNFGRYTEIIVEAYCNDSIKQFLADVIIKNEANNLAILKINNLGKDTLHDIAYTFYEKANLDLESELYSIYFTKSDTNTNKPKTISGKLKSKARFENFSNYFETSLKTEGIALGGAIFTNTGELLGIITTPSMRNNTIATKLNVAEQLIFYSNQKFKKTKRSKEFSSFESVSKNVVLIKVK